MYGDLSLRNPKELYRSERLFRVIDRVWFLATKRICREPDFTQEGLNDNFARQATGWIRSNVATARNDRNAAMVGVSSTMRGFSGANPKRRRFLSDNNVNLECKPISGNSPISSSDKTDLFVG